MSARFKLAITELRKDCEQLLNEEKRLVADLEAVRADLESGNLAIEALEREASAKRRTSKQCATQQEVIATLLSLHTEDRMASLETLEKRARTALSLKGKSLSGFKLRMQEALADPRIHHLFFAVHSQEQNGVA